MFAPVAALQTPRSLDGHIRRIIAALNQGEIAVTVTNTVLIAVLGTIAGILVVGVGGGLVKPMQARWERYLSTAETESSNIKEQVQGGSGTPQRVSALQTSTTGATAPVTRPIDTQAPGSRWRRRRPSARDDTLVAAASRSPRVNAPEGGGTEGRHRPPACPEPCEPAAQRRSRL